MFEIKSKPRNIIQTIIQHKIINNKSQLKTQKKSIHILSKYDMLILHIIPLLPNQNMIKHKHTTNQSLIKLFNTNIIRTR